MTTNEYTTCPFCINVARDIALEGMIEILLDDEVADDYDAAYALVNDTVDMWENVAEIVDGWASENRHVCESFKD